MKIKPIKKVKQVRKTRSNVRKIRRFWLINPKTRVKKSAKIYTRSKVKKATQRLVEEVK